jgi:hypothetical protein
MGGTADGTLSSGDMLRIAAKTRCLFAAGASNLSRIHGDRVKRECREGKLEEGAMTGNAHAQPFCIVWSSLI